MRCALAVLSCFVLACDDDDTSPVDGSVMDGMTGVCVEALFDPLGDDLFPNPAMMVEADTPTGRQLVVNERFTSLTRYEQLLPMVTDGLSALDGFGTSAGAAFRFNAPVSLESPRADALTDGAGFVVLESEGARFQGAEIVLEDEGTSLRMRPYIPLPAATWVAAFATRSLAECSEQAPWLQELLAAPDARTREALMALEAEGIESEDLLALVVYPTQSLYTMDEAIAADIEAMSVEDLAPTPPRVCISGPARTRRCFVTLRANDYRDPDGVIRNAEASAQWDLNFITWVPSDVEGPVPTVVFGHGLSVGAPDSAPPFVGDAARRGVALVASSALEHPGHPTAEDGVPQAQILTNFFGIDLETGTVDALRLRDHFRQTIFDRLQVIRLLKLQPDIFGDEAQALDPTRFAYFGSSLGSILGVQLLALSDFPAATLALPGGRVSQLLTDQEGSFSLVVGAVLPGGLRFSEQSRLFLILQTIIEAGDPVNWASQVFDTEQAPAVLGIMSLDDNVVTNNATFDLVRAMGIDVMPPILRDAPGIRMAPAPPLRNNRQGITAALQHFDLLENGSISNHDTTSVSDLTAFSAYHLFESAWNGEAEIVDPYAGLNVPRAE